MKGAGPSRAAAEPAAGVHESTVATPEIDARIDAQNATSTLLQRYTEQHPDIVSTRRC
jgi:hypothetical protein